MGVSFIRTTQRRTMKPAVVLLMVSIGLVLIASVLGEEPRTLIKRDGLIRRHRRAHPLAIQRKVRSAFDNFVINGRIDCCINCIPSCHCCYAWIILRYIIFPLHWSFPSCVLRRLFQRAQQLDDILGERKNKNRRHPPSLVAVYWKKVNASIVHSVDL